jgi:hypothetical protein
MAPLTRKFIGATLKNPWAGTPSAALNLLDRG